MTRPRVAILLVEALLLWFGFAVTHVGTFIEPAWIGITSVWAVVVAGIVFIELMAGEK